jgi:hypothetical protein
MGTTISLVFLLKKYPWLIDLTPTVTNIMSVIGIVEQDFVLSPSIYRFNEQY